MSKPSLVISYTFNSNISSKPDIFLLTLKCKHLIIINHEQPHAFLTILNLKPCFRSSNTNKSHINSKLTNYELSYREKKYTTNNNKHFKLTHHYYRKARNPFQQLKNQACCFPPSNHRKQTQPP